MIDERLSQEPESWEREPWVRELDDLVRSSLVMAPPAQVQQSILAAVLLAAAPQHVVMPIPIAEPVRPVPLAAYVLLAVVLVAYVASVSWLEGLFGNVTWVSILFRQLLAATEQTVGRPAATEPFTLAWRLVLQAPWIALLPVGWLLWDRDRASAPTA
jgi:hypothetical protein